MFVSRVRFLLLALATGISECGEKPASEAVVYVALDEMYARPVLDAFEKSAGINVRAVYDTEASKTTGLVNRLLAERDRPRADVFWNNEAVQTERLKAAGALAAYQPAAAEPIPPAFKDAGGYWTGLAARARVIIYNTELVNTPPTSIHDLLDPAWRGKAAIARPLFGTTASHAAALFAVWGDSEARAFFDGIKANDVAILAGNATVRDEVARGRYAWGLTDTDDANGGVEDGYPVAWRFPDQEEAGLGTLVIPNTVALIEGGPNPENGKQLIEFLLSPEVESMLAQSRSIQIPLNPAADSPESVPDLSEIRAMEVTFEEAAAAMPEAMRFIESEFLQ